MPYLWRRKRFGMPEGMSIEYGVDGESGHASGGQDYTYETVGEIALAVFPHSGELVHKLD